MINKDIKKDTLIEQKILYKEFERMLWQFSCENGELENEWNGQNLHYGITRSINGNFYIFEDNFYRREGTIYFSSEEIAERAIKEIIEPFIKKYPDFI